MTADPDAGVTARTRERDLVVPAVLALAGVALLVRVLGLGGRPFHWDEARVGYWTLRYLESGAFQYRPVAGGPLLYVVDRHVFALLGATDASARLVVALVGGALPLAALLFRTRLRDDETVVLAAVLAGAPVLVYYSRFLRGDLPLAAFALVTLGAAVRAVDADDRRFLPLAVVAGALAVASSGFAVAYLLCWGIAALAALDTAWLVDARRARDRLDAVADRLRAWRRSLYWSGVAGALALLFLFAPRAGATDGPGLWKPTTFPAAVEAAFLGSIRKFWGVRVTSRRFGATHELLPFVADYADLLVALALPVVALAAVAFLADRYGGSPRPLVTFAGVWAGATLLVVPMVTEIMAPWLVVHTVVALSVPAAVGGATLIRAGRRAATRDDAVTVAAAVLLVLAVLAQAGAVTAGGVYGPTDRSNRFAQYAQPADDLDPLVENVSVAIRGNDGVDVLYVGERYYTAYEAGNEQPPVAEEWGNRLPLPWYFERVGAEAGSVERVADLANVSGPPPVIVAVPSLSIGVPTLSNVFPVTVTSTSNSRSPVRPLR